MTFGSQNWCLGDLTNKSNYLENFLSQLYVKKFDEREARKHFQLLIDAVDYCHSRGVYHRDLKVRMKLSCSGLLSLLGENWKFTWILAFLFTARKLAFGQKRKSESIRFWTQRVAKGNRHLFFLDILPPYDLGLVRIDSSTFKR